MVSTLGALTSNRAVTFGTQRTLFGSDVALYPLSSGARFNYGLALAEAGDYEGAMHAYRQAIALNTQYAEAYYNIGELERVAGKVSSALYYHEQAADLPTIAPLGLARCLTEWISRGNSEMPESINSESRPVTKFIPMRPATKSLPKNCRTMSGSACRNYKYRFRQRPIKILSIRRRSWPQRR